MRSRRGQCEVDVHERKRASERRLALYLLARRCLHVIGSRRHSFAALMPMGAAPNYYDIYSITILFQCLSASWHRNCHKLYLVLGVTL